MAKEKKNTKLLKILIPVIIVVLIAVALVVVLLIPEDAANDPTSAIDPTGVAGIKDSVNKDKLHQASVEKDKDGNVKENGAGSLLSYIPRNIKTIKIENTKSSYTIKSYTPVTKEKDENGKEVEKTQATQYTLVGYEDKEIKEGAPDSIANDAASLKFTQIVSSGDKDEKEFGFNKPRSTVTVTYEDKTSAKIIVGNKAPANAGYYIKFGDGKEIYLVTEDAIDSFLYGINDLMSLDVTDPASDGDNASPSSVVIGGTRYKEKIEFTPSDDETATTNYIITKPSFYYGNDQGCSEVEAGIRGVAAVSVVCVNPTSAQLDKYGLSTPYATVDAVYPDVSISLIASKPDNNDHCYLMVKGGDVIYRILDDSIMWVKSSLEDLRSSYFVDNEMTALSSAEVKFGGNDYKFQLSTKGSDTSVKYNGKKVNTGDFQTAFDYMHGSTFTRHEFTNENLSGSPSMTIIFNYSGDRSQDTMEFYEIGSKVYVKVNGEQISYTYKNAVTDLQKAFTKAAKGK